MTTASQLVAMTATEAVSALRKREASPVELLDAAIAHIEACDGAINALPTRFFEKARAAAKAFKPDDSDRRSGYLYGLPFVAKEYNDIAGERTTFGSPIFADHIALETDHAVTVLQNAGGIPMAKSNVPEFAGSNTFNPVFGATRNPWDTRMSAGGSSGGAAAALSARMAWLAMGSDVGGSLRIPASFCGIVGLRPSVGRVARGDGLLPYDPIWVEGPMARNVADLALMLDAQTYQSERDPLSRPPPERPFLDVAREARPPRRVRYTADLGLSEVDAEVAAISRAACDRFALMGADIGEAEIDFSGAIETFQTQRAILFATFRGDLLKTDRDRLPAPIIWNLEKGLNLTMDEVLGAERGRAALFGRMRQFFATADILALPTVAVPPFIVEQAYPTEINGKQLLTYIDWMALTFAITVTGCPAISVPCGFTKTGLPVGLQLVGRPHADAEVIAAAAALERELALNTTPSLAGQV